MPTLTKSYSLAVVRGLTANELVKLKKAGIASTRKLLAATAQGAKAEHELASRAGLTLAKLREAVQRASLLGLEGLGPRMALLLEGAGVASTQQLAGSRSGQLAEALARYVASHPELKCRLPSPTTVASLVARAQKLNSKQAR